ncbi:aryl-sulfate sulfotransferase [Barrientosiimonas marina]|uniref:Aryl-sulfate sulfotransferase n=1 Tax=Lentibacillus kimchii TaxID=1542911 RepID=A0ABW2UYF2_9BACI
MKKILTISAVVVVASLAFVFFFLNNDTNQEADNHSKDSEAAEKQKEKPYPYPPKKASKRLDKQEKLEATMADESEGSTLSNPYVKLDPYDRSPLAALVVFDTEQAAKVSFTVKGKDASSTISNTIDDYRTHHELAVLGLYPDQDNKVTITAETEDGDTSEKTITITTEKLPDYIPTVNIKTAKKDKMDIQPNELTFAIPSTKYNYGFDTNGDIRWYGSGYNSHIFHELDNGHLLYLGKDDNSGGAYNRLFETNYLGKLYNAFKISEEVAEAESDGMESTLIHHDAAELPSGNLLLTVNDDEGTYKEDTMIEINRKTGDVVNQIDLKDLFPADAYEEYGGNDFKPGDDPVDWFHQNAVVYDDDDNSIIISGRNSDTVMKIDYETEEIQWILAYPEDWDKQMEQYLVEGQGDDFKYPAGQHDVRILPDFDDNPDTIDLLLYDNNTVVTRGNEDLSKEFSAASHYRVNEKTKEAKLIWTYGEERGEDFFTNIIGSARYQPNTGNVLIGFGHVDEGNQSNIVEVTHDDDANVVFEAEMDDFPSGAWVYRGVRHQLYTDTWENTASFLE